MERERKKTLLILGRSPEMISMFRRTFATKFSVLTLVTATLDQSVLLKANADVLLIVGDTTLLEAVESYEGELLPRNYYANLFGANLKPLRSDIMGFCNKKGKPVLLFIEDLLGDILKDLAKKGLAKSKANLKGKAVYVVFNTEKYSELWERLLQNKLDALGITGLYRYLKPDLVADTIIVISDTSGDLAGEVDYYKGDAAIVWIGYSGHPAPKKKNILRSTISVVSEDSTEQLMRAIKESVRSA